MMTAGSTLQNGKYLIRSVLHQSDFAISYQATHSLLNQPVILQTLNDSLRQHPRFEQIRQLFLQEVRRLAQEQPGAIVKIQDYFEEAGTPFIVLDISSRSQAKSAEWLKFLNRAVLGSPPEAAKPMGKARSETIANIPSTASNGRSPVPVPPSDTQPAAKAALSNGHIPTARPKQRWMPKALLITAIVGISAGAGIGLSLRFQPLRAANAPSIFSSEQDFPDREDWLGEDPYAESYTRSTAESPANFLPVTPRRRAASQPAPLDYTPRPARVREILPPAPAPTEKAIPPEPIPEPSAPTDLAPPTPIAPVEPPPAKVAPAPAQTPPPLAPAPDAVPPAVQ